MISLKELAKESHLMPPWRHGFSMRDDNRVYLWQSCPNVRIMKGTSMRSLSLIPAVLALFFSTAAYSQVWSEWADRENRFTVNFPGDPDKKEVPYKTTKGTNLTARVF